jgi:hypothetical protein
MLKTQEGTFQASETLNVEDNTNVATATGDSYGGKTVSVAAGADTQLHVKNHGLTDDDFIRMSGSRNFDDEHDVKSVTDADNIVIDQSYPAGGEVFTGDEKVYVGIRQCKAISMAYVSGSDGNYRGTLPDTAEKLFERSMYYVFIDVIGVSGTVLTHRLKWKAVFYPDDS